jgi:phage repressor protein C with HTH and peptisase S24 domain/transcriptional regulator with XRE-family HTH domain
VNPSTEKVNKSEKFSERLLRWRAEHDLKQQDAALLLDVGRTYLSQLEQGREPGPVLVARFDRLAQMSTADVHSKLAEQKAFKKPVLLIGAGASLPAAVPARYETFAERLGAWCARQGGDEKKCARTLGIGVVKYRELLGGREPVRTLAAKFNEIEFASDSAVAEVHVERDARMRQQRQESTGVRNAPAGDVPLHGVRKIPVIGWAQAGELVEYEDVVDQDRVVHIEVRNPRAFAIVINGDSMQPLIAAGDLVVVCPGDRPVNERFVVARLKSGGVVCKQFRRLSEKEYELHSLNSLYPPIRVLATDVVWMYPVANLIKSL